MEEFETDEEVSLDQSVMKDQIANSRISRTILQNKIFLMHKIHSIIPPDIHTFERTMILAGLNTGNLLKGVELGEEILRRL